MLNPVGDVSRVPREGKPLPYEFLPLINHYKKPQLEMRNRKLETVSPVICCRRFGASADAPYLPSLRDTFLQRKAKKMAVLPET